MKIIKEIKKDVKKVVKVAQAVVGGAIDYRNADIAAHAQAATIVGAHQKEMIRNVGTPGAPTPMGTNAFYGAVDTEAAKIKKQKNVTLRNSIRSKLGM